MSDVPAAPGGRPSAAGAAQQPASVVVDDLTGRLELPVAAVLAAAGISGRTFSAWRTAGDRGPRLADQSRLWALLQTVEDLEELVDGGLPGWLRADPRRCALLRSGDFDEVLRAAEPPGSVAVTGAPDYAAAYGVGGDRTDDADVPASEVRRRSVPSAPTARRRATRRER